MRGAVATALCRRALRTEQRNSASTERGGYNLYEMASRSVEASGFTLAELLVSVGVLVVLVLLFTQLINSAATVSILGHKRMDADSEARQVLDRMAIDFAQIVKRTDVDYYVKLGQPAATTKRSNSLLQCCAGLLSDKSFRAYLYAGKSGLTC